MRKKVLAVILVLMMIISSTINVFAYDSRNANVSTKTEGIFVECDIQQTETFEQVRETVPKIGDAIMDVNKGEVNMQGFIESIPEKAMDDECKTELEDKEFVTGFFDITQDGAKQNEDGTYLVVLDVPQLTKAMRNVKVLHYKMDSTQFEVIEPESVDLNSKKVTIKIESFSPFAIIADIDTVVLDTPVGTAPKTDTVTTNWEIWIIVACVMGMAGVKIMNRKRS